MTENVESDAASFLNFVSAGENLSPEQLEYVKLYQAEMEKIVHEIYQNVKAEFKSNKVSEPLGE